MKIYKNLVKWNFHNENRSGLKKKMKSQSPSSNSSSSSLGSPSSPPSLSSCPYLTNILDEEQCNLYGIDEQTYEEDSKSGFVMDDGKELTGNDLIHYLNYKNEQLLFKAKLYKDKFENLQHELQTENERKLHSVRGFYKNLMCSISRSAKMLRAAKLK